MVVVAAAAKAAAALSGGVVTVDSLRHTVERRQCGRGRGAGESEWPGCPDAGRQPEPGLDPRAGNELTSILR